MIEGIRILDVRRRLGKEQWRVPTEYGPDGFMLERFDRKGRILISVSPVPPFVDLNDVWVHASIKMTDGSSAYDALVLLHHAVWNTGYAYQVFAPPERHVNINPDVYHLWGYPDGRIVLPDFGIFGSI